MSTLEATVDMMERLSEENLVKVQYGTRQQANAGRYRDAQEVVNDIRRGCCIKMISDSFDMESEAIITPSSFLEKGENLRYCNSNISREIFPAVLKLLKMKRLVR